MQLSNSSLCVPKDTELAQSASLSHRSTPLLWQTGRLTSFIPVAPLCSSFSSKTILTITSVLSAWLHSVPRCLLLIWSGAPVDISAPTLLIRIKNVLNTQQRAFKTSQKVRSTNVITFLLCETHVHYTEYISPLTPRSFARSRKVMLCQSLPEDSMACIPYFNRWAAWPSLNPSEAVSITGSMRGGEEAESMEGLLHCTPHYLSLHSNWQLLNAHSCQSRVSFTILSGISLRTKLCRSHWCLWMKQQSNSTVWRRHFLIFFFLITQQPKRFMRELAFKQA